MQRKWKILVDRGLLEANADLLARYLLEVEEGLVEAEDDRDGDLYGMFLEDKKEITAQLTLLTEILAL